MCDHGFSPYLLDMTFGRIGMQIGNEKNYRGKVRKVAKIPCRILNLSEKFPTLEEKSVKGCKNLL